MKKVIVLSALLLFGVLLSQWLPVLLAENYASARQIIMFLTMTTLAYIMIDAGSEFFIDKTRLSGFAGDYLIAMSSATLPWLFVVLYFIYILMPETQWHSAETWKEMLLIGRFAAPTSAGVLFTMLAAAGLGATWVFRKARVLAIFDDLDTVLLMIPLTIIMIGPSWQMATVLIILLCMLFIGYRCLRSLNIPANWQWTLVYAALIASFSEAVLAGSYLLDPEVPVHVEVLLPAFLLGCMMKYPDSDHHTHKRQQANTTIAATFMVLVGLSMPHMNLSFTQETAASPDTLTSATLLLHVLMVTLLSNLGKMFPLFCYRRKASFKERLALCISLFPRGEVGAGVLIISLGYGIGGDVLTIAMLSLMLNLFLTGFFILLVKKLLSEPSPPGRQTAESLVYARKD